LKPTAEASLIILVDNDYPALKVGDEGRRFPPLPGKDKIKQWSHDELSSRDSRRRSSSSNNNIFNNYTSLLVRNWVVNVVYSYDIGREKGRSSDDVVWRGGTKAEQIYYFLRCLSIFRGPSI